MKTVTYSHKQGLKMFTCKVALDNMLQPNMLRNSLDNNIPRAGRNFLGN